MGQFIIPNRALVFKQTNILVGNFCLNGKLSKFTISIKFNLQPQWKLDVGLAQVWNVHLEGNVGALHHEEHLEQLEQSLLTMCSLGTFLSLIGCST